MAILDPTVRDPPAAVVVYLAWPIALLIQAVVLSIMAKQKFTFLNLRFVIPLHFIVEFLFTMTFINLSADDLGFRVTLALHGLTDCMFAFNMLFRREMAQKVFYYAFILWSVTTAAGVILYYPLDLVLGTSLFVVPMDVLTFLGAISVIRRTTNDRARLAAYFMLYHMFSAFIIFGMFLGKAEFGYALVVNAAHILICVILWAPIAHLSDERLVTEGITPALGLERPKSDAPESPSNDVSIAMSGSESSAGTPPVVTATDMFSPTRLENPKHTFVIAGVIVAAFFGIVLICVFATYTTSFWDLVESPVDYYHPGRIGAI